MKSKKQMENLKQYLTLDNKTDLLYQALVESVKDRLSNNCAFLLSGGMDSSIICAIASKLNDEMSQDWVKASKLNDEMSQDWVKASKLNDETSQDWVKASKLNDEMSQDPLFVSPIKEDEMIQNNTTVTHISEKIKYIKLNKSITTFAIGTSINSTDLVAAREVASFIGSTHHEIICSEQDFVDAIEETIYFEETYDTTTIRAGVGMNLIAKKVKAAGFNVVITGEGSDELFGSYRYFLNAPSAQAHVEETNRLLKDLRYFDVLRCDRTISNNGLEARVPFLDSRVVDAVHNNFTEEDYLPKHGLMKFILRNVAKKYNLLPTNIYTRPKEAFSDGVSSVGKNWWDIVDEICYEQIYRKYFGFIYEPTPYKWLPRWCGEQGDPSARILSVKESAVDWDEKNN